MAELLCPADSRLLDLPESLHMETLSWCGDNHDSVDAILATCRALHGLRREPLAMALLLLRCPSYNMIPRQMWVSPTPRLTHLRAAAAVLHMLQAGPRAGGPFTASRPLLHGLLHWAAWNGDAALLRRLLSLPGSHTNGALFRRALPPFHHPFIPEVHAEDFSEPPLSDGITPEGRGLLGLAISRGCSVEVVDLFLELGAAPVDRYTVCGWDVPLREAVEQRVPVGVLASLLHYLPQHCQARAQKEAARLAVDADSCVAMAYLLPLPGCPPVGRVLNRAAAQNSLCLTAMLVARADVVDAEKGHALVSACHRGYLESAEILLENGRDVHFGWGEALRSAVDERHVLVVHMLLQRGAVATPVLLESSSRSN